jgi:hypothetical protein
VGAAVHQLGQAVDEHRDELADADAVGRQIGAIKQELCAPKPRRAVHSGLVEELAEQVAAVDELADAAGLVRREVAAYLGWRFGGGSIG